MTSAETFRRLEKEALDMAPHPDPRFPPSPYYRFLHVLAAEMEPELSVELGVCGGGASFHLATGWPAGAVVGVEHASGSDHERANWEHMDENCNNFRLWKGDSIESAPYIFNEFGLVDILFIDTVHTYRRTIDEFEAWQPYMAEKSVVCLDDLHRTEMGGVWRWMPRKKMRMDDLHSGRDEGGFGVVWRP